MTFLLFLLACAIVESLAERAWRAWRRREPPEEPRGIGHRYLYREFDPALRDATRQRREAAAAARRQGNHIDSTPATPKPPAKLERIK
jgi:hypothetical protein